MSYALFKALLSGLLIMLISEIAKRNPSLGGLIASLPLLSVLAMIWMWRETGDAEKIAAHAQSTFWFVLPSLPMFLVLPALLRHGWNFAPAMLASCTLTMLLYAGMIWAFKRAGFTI